MNYKLNLKIFIINSAIYNFLNFFREIIVWHRQNYRGRSPTFIKRSLLIKNSLPNSIWIETGTYLGQTSKFLSKNSFQVYTIEPEKNLFKSVKKYLNKYKNIITINNTSELALEKLLSKKIKKNVNFFLDAHNVSNNNTKTYKGSVSNPILNELQIIKKKINNLKNFIIFIDDVNWHKIDYVGTHKNTTSKLDQIINWCRKNNLCWEIDHNVMICKKNTNRVGEKF
jgi:hypothetical protein